MTVNKMKTKMEGGYYGVFQLAADDTHEVCWSIGTGLN
jgi:hypothetical protein